MILTNPPLPLPAVAQQYSTHQKQQQDGDQGPSVHGIAAHPTSTTERGKFTYPQQADTGHFQKQPLPQTLHNSN